jgi:cell division septation protein DedD
MKAIRSGIVGWIVLVALSAVVLAVVARNNRSTVPAPRHRDVQSTRPPVARATKDDRVTNRNAVDFWARPDDVCAADEEVAAAKQQGRVPDLTEAHRALYHLSLPARIRVRIFEHARVTCATPQHDVMMAHVEITDANSGADGQAGWVTEAALSQERRAGSKPDRPVSGQARFRRGAAGTYR